MEKKKILAYALLFCATLIWGLAYPILAYLIDLDAMSYAMINFLRFGLGMLVLLPFAIKQFKLLNKSSIIISLISGVILFFAFLLLTISISDGTPSVSAFFINASIFVVPLLSSIVNKKAVKPYVILCTTIVFIGFIFLFFKDGFVLPDGKFNLSILFALSSAILFSIQIFILGRYHKNENTSLCVSWIQIAVVTVLFLLYILIFESAHLFAISGTSFILPIIFLGILATGITYYFQTKASAIVSENSCNIVLSLESLFASIFSIIFGFEILSPIYCMAFIIIAVGIVLFIIMDNRSKAIKDKK